MKCRPPPVAPGTGERVIEAIVPMAVVSRPRPPTVGMATVPGAIRPGAGLNPPLPSVLMALGAVGLNPAVPSLGKTLVGAGLRPVRPVALPAPLAAPVKSDADPVPPNSALVSGRAGPS